MMTVNEVSKLTGVSVRTLQYYDRIGLLHPAEHTGAGYRLYDENTLERLQQILLFRELQFPLKEIRRILDAPNFDRGKALEQQITLLTLRKEHLENLIAFAHKIRLTGVREMDFTAFDDRKLDEYARRARESWGDTPAYREFETRHRGRTKDDERELGSRMMSIFAEFGAIRDRAPDAPEAQALVDRLQAFITEHYYACTDEILASLGQMYAGGGEFTDNIDRAGGSGTAGFVNRAIQIHCGRS